MGEMMMIAAKCLAKLQHVKAACKKQQTMSQHNVWPTSAYQNALGISRTHAWNKTLLYCSFSKAAVTVLHHVAA